MVGLLYKEFRQNSVWLLLTVGIAVVLIAQPIMMVNEFGGGDGQFMMLAMLLYSALIFMVTGFMEGNMFQTDERKKWAYFVTATPKAAAGHIWTKYVYTLMISCFCMVWCSALDMVFAFVMEHDNIEVILSSLLFLQVFLRAIEIPFWVRFGVKRGSMIKAAMLLVLILIAVVYALFGDLSVFFSTDDFVSKLIDFFINFMSGNLPDWFKVVQALFPFAAAGCYYLSYKLSCRLFLKGVEGFEK